MSFISRFYIQNPLFLKPIADNDCLLTVKKTRIQEIRESSSAYKLSETKKGENTFEYTIDIASISASEKGKAQVKAQNKNAALTCPFTIILNEEGKKGITPGEQIN
jgi:hypothetical protein